MATNLNAKMIADTDVASVLNRYNKHTEPNDKTFGFTAIKRLLRRIKGNTATVNALLNAIMTEGAHSTECVLIERPIDGRIQIATQKYAPHAVYYAIFRCPGVDKKALVPRVECQYPYHDTSGLELVCINPYHYEEVHNDNQPGPSTSQTTTVITELPTPVPNPSIAPLPEFITQLPLSQPFDSVSMQFAQAFLSANAHLLNGNSNGNNANDKNI